MVDKETDTKVELVTLSTNVKQEVLERLRSFCKDRGLVQGPFVSKAIMEKIDRELENEG
jgi:hypothetical protein